MKEDRWKYNAHIEAIQYAKELHQEKYYEPEFAKDIDATFRDFEAGYIKGYEAGYMQCRQTCTKTNTRQ